MADKKKRLLVAIGILIICETLSLLSKAGPIVGLSNSLSMYSILLLDIVPYFSIMQLFLSQILLIINDVIQGFDIKDAMNNTGVIEVYSWFALIIFYMQFYKKTNNGSIKEVIFYKREVLEIPAWSKFMIYCLLASMIFTTANSSQLDFYRDRIHLRILAGVATVLPSISILARYTTTDIAYELLTLTIVSKFISLILLGKQGELDIITVISFIVETVIIVYSIVSRYKHKKKEAIE